MFALMVAFNVLFSLGVVVAAIIGRAAYKVAEKRGMKTGNLDMALDYFTISGVAGVFLCAAPIPLGLVLVVFGFVCWFTFWSVGKLSALLEKLFERLM